MVGWRGEGWDRTVGRGKGTVGRREVRVHHVTGVGGPEQEQGDTPCFSVGASEVTGSPSYPSDSWAGRGAVWLVMGITQAGQGHQGLQSSVIQRVSHPLRTRMKRLRCRECEQRPQVPGEARLSSGPAASGSAVVSTLSDHGKKVVTHSDPVQTHTEPQGTTGLPSPATGSPWITRRAAFPPPCRWILCGVLFQ